MTKAWAFLVVAATGLSGCCGLHVPTLLGPGSAEHQRGWAQRYDPYPQGEVGPDIDGGRPRDFDILRSECQRARQFYQAPYQRSSR